VWISLEGMLTSFPLDTITAMVRARAVVVGAPGSGKTELLMQRCESLIHQGVSVDGLMIATPTRAAATQLRDVLGLRLGVATEGARVRSLAALAFAVVQDFHHQHGLAVPDLMKASQIDTDIQALLLGHDEDRSGPAWPEPLGSDVRATRAFRQELREWIARAGETAATSAEIRESAVRAGRADWVAAIEFRDEYQRIISSARPGAFDSGEIFARAIVALEQGIPPRWAGLQHLLVDDAHDLTHAGLEFLLAFSRHGVGMTVVSEPDVAGNTFRGSEPAGHAILAAAWGVQGVVLTHVWRHGKKIRQAVAEVTSRIGAAQAGKQRAAGAGDQDSLLQTMLVPSPGGEAFALAGMIRHAQLEQGLELGDIAVIARRGTRVSELVRELSLWGIPARQSLSGASLRDQQAAKELVELLALGLGILPLTSRTAVAALQGLYGGMSAQEMRRLRFALRRGASADEPYRHIDVVLAQALSHRGGFVLLDSAIAHKAHTLAGLLADIADNPLPAFRMLCGNCGKERGPTAVGLKGQLPRPGVVEELTAPSMLWLPFSRRRRTLGSPPRVAMQRCSSTPCSTPKFLKMRCYPLPWRLPCWSLPPRALWDLNFIRCLLPGWKRGCGQTSVFGGPSWHPTAFPQPFGRLTTTASMKQKWFAMMKYGCLL